MISYVTVLNTWVIESDQLHKARLPIPLVARIIDTHLNKSDSRYIPKTLR